jgi:predicted MPP superfamily phosphohydrolase
MTTSSERPLNKLLGRDINSQINHLDGLTQLLKEIQPRYGKFAVTGNHEFYAGLAQALDFTRRAGFKVLRGEALTLAGILNLAGVEVIIAGAGWAAHLAGLVPQGRRVCSHPALAL